MNMCTFVGRIGRDAETRQVGETTVTGFSLASDVGYGDNKTTIWLDCSLWGKRGTSLENSLLKGADLTVIGELSEREYVNKDGETKRSLSLRVAECTYPKLPAPAQSQLQGQPVTLAQAVDDAIPF